MSTNKSMSRRAELLLVLGLAVALTGCAEVLGAVLDAGPNVAANGQIGAENSQTIGVVTQVEPHNVEHLVVENRDFPTLLLLLLAAIVGTVGWLAPTPQRIWQKWKSK